MRRIRIEKVVRRRGDRGRYDVLPLDPRDPAILFAKGPARRAARSHSGGRR